MVWKTNFDSEVKGNKDLEKNKKDNYFLTFLPTKIP